MIKVQLNNYQATAFGPFPFDMLKFIASLPGRKKWNGQRSVAFDASPDTIRRMKESKLAFKFEDITGTMNDIDELQAMATQHAPAVELVTKYKPKIPLRDYQTKAVALARGREAYAYLFEMGLGKTACTICDLGILHLEYGIQGAMVVAPKGVDAQWLESEIPKHISDQVKWQAIKWEGKPIKSFALKQGTFYVFAINIDALRTDKGFEAASAFFRATGKNAAMVIDESHTIKNFTADRTKAALALGQMVTYRRILTGTPIARSLEDAFAQFYFLNMHILGHKYKTSFRSRYCIMGGYEGKQVVGQKNVEEFYSMIAPHSFRLTKAEALDLPPKIYVNVEYDLGPKSRKAYDDLKKKMLTKLDDGSVASVNEAPTLVLRLQELVCGRLMREDGEYEDFGEERIEQLLNILEQVEGPVVIWARFKRDIEKITDRLNRSNLGRAKAYYGESSKAEREDAKQSFLNGMIRFFVATQAAGGTGLNLQGHCANVVYYSQDFNAITRWQSEDRTHRIGMLGDKMTYFNIIARKTVDRLIAGNLNDKKETAKLTLDTIRSMIKG